MRRALPFLLLAAAASIVGACAPSPAEPVVGRSGQNAATQQRTLVVINYGELPSIAAKPLGSFAGSLAHPVELFNGTLDQSNERGYPEPVLAEAIPQLNSDTWRVFPEGRMETRYRLRPHLVWHDGTPLSAEDFLFGWRVYATPDYGLSRSAPIGDMEGLDAPDDRTVIIRWTRSFADANALDRGFQALPRHILEESFQRRPDELANHPFWSSEYVGLGPPQRCAISRTAGSSAT